MNEEQSPQVTIIVPCYNVGKFLPQCLDSLIHQTYENIRILAVDDVSPDNSAQVIREYEQKDPRVKGIFHQVNSGVSVARNSGIAELNSPWVFFLDGDDWLEADTISRMLETQKRANADIVCCNMLECNEDGTENGRVEYPQQGLHTLQFDEGLEDVLEHQGVLCVCTAKLFRSSLILETGIRFDERLRHAQDTLFTHTVVLQNRPRVVMDYDHCGYRYRQFGNSCVHAIPLDKRLGYIEILVTELDGLAMRLGYSRRLAVRKAAEYFWGIRKFSKDNVERRRRVEEVVSKPFFHEHLYPILSQFGKWKHRMLLRLMSRGHTGWIRYW